MIKRIKGIRELFRLRRRRNKIPPSPPVDQETAAAEPEWKKRYRAINELCDKRKEEFRLAGGGRIVSDETLESVSDNN